MSRFIGQFSASYRVFCTDLGKLLKQIAADRCGLVWLLCIALVGAVVRIWFLNQPMRQDEAQTYLSFVAQGADRLFYYQAPNNHVAHTLLVYLSTSILGAEPWAIRFPAFLAGTLLIPMTYLCSRTVFLRSSGLVAAGLVAGSPYLVLFSTNARGYSGIVLLTVAMVPLTLYYVRNESVFAGFLIALLSAIGLYTIPIMLFPIAMLMAWSLLLAYHTGGLARTLRMVQCVALTLLLCAIVTLILYTPVFLTSGVRPVVANQYVQPKTLTEAVAAWPYLALGTWVQYHRDIPTPLQVCLGGCVLVGTLYLWRANRSAFLLIPAALIGIVIVLLATRSVPFVRTWIFLLPLAFSLTDTGIAGVMTLLADRTRVSVAAALGLLFALGVSYHLIATQALYQYPETGILPDAEKIVDYLQPRLKEGDSVLVTKYWPLRYYGYRQGISLPVFSRQGWGDGDYYVVVRLPMETFERVVDKNHPQLDEKDFAVQEFPSALLFYPNR